MIQRADSAPIFGEPLSSIALSGAAGLVFTGAQGATLASIPAVTLLAGKALLIKKLLLKKGKPEKKIKIESLIIYKHCFQPYLMACCPNSQLEASRKVEGPTMRGIRGGWDSTIGEEDDALNFD